MASKQAFEFLREGFIYKNRNIFDWTILSIVMNGRSALYFQILRLENTKSHFFYIVLKPSLAGCMRLPVQTDDYGAVPWILTSSQTTTPWGPCWSDTPLTDWSSSTNIRNIKTSSALTVMSFAFLVGKFCSPVTGQDTAVRKTKESSGNSSPAECWPTTPQCTPSVRSVVVGSQISPQGLFPFRCVLCAPDTTILLSS